VEINKQIHALKHFFTIPLGKGKMVERFVYSFIIFGDYITLIDTGIKDSYTKIYEYISSMNRKITEIDKIILSHAHPDHMGSAFRIKQDTDCIVFGHESELLWFENIEIQFNSRAVQGFFSMLDKSVEIDVLIEDNDIIHPSGAEEMKILHTPGHSPGSISILLNNSNILFTSDAIPCINEIPTYDSFKQLKNSLTKIQGIKPKTLLTSWHDPINDLTEKELLMKNAFKYLEKLDNAVKKYYTSENDFALRNCQKLVEGLGLPGFYINPTVNKSLRTHL
jgi:glyoxylase-like metal-dependent hydrolase (beta-lactamase superfamily II)